MNKLTFTALRAANTARLPLFKNAQGELAHAEPDGSDWSPGDWMTAIVGELGEAANIMKKIKRGDFGWPHPNNEAYAVALKKLAKEFADVVTYVDLTAFQYRVDLGQAVEDKFNEVSDRVDVPIVFRDGQAYYRDELAGGGQSTLRPLGD